MNQTQSPNVEPKSGLKEKGLSSFCVHIVSSFERGLERGGLSPLSVQTIVSLELRPLLFWIMGSFLLEQDGCRCTLPVLFG